jgi:hypothetical protein
MKKLHIIPRLGLALLLGCGGGSAEEQSAPENPQMAFWQNLESLCGRSFEGQLIESNPPDARFDGQRFVMHVRKCQSNEIRIPFFIGDDRSRTWVVTRTEAGLRLKHDHRHEDGSEDEVTQYGGDTNAKGTSVAQEFHADAYTAELLPVSSTNIWTMSLEPGRVFAYALRRTDSDRRFKVEFDLSNPVEAPPPPWGD